MIKKLLAPLIIIIAIVIVFILIKQKPRPETKAVEDKKTISLLISESNPEQHPLIIPAEGFVNSRWQTTLSSQVAGRVIEISDQLLVGNEFDEGDVLIKINPLDYQVQVARARANVKSAEAALVEQKMQSKRAESDWKKLNPNRKPNDFNLRIPQLKNAESNTQAAKDELRLAQENLNRASIKAPFDGFSITRSVDLGEQLQVGEAVAEIVDSKKLELKISLTNSQAELVKNAEQVKFMLSTSDSSINTLTELKVDKTRFEPFIDNENRFRSVVLELTSDETQTNFKPLVGEFLNLEIQVQQKNELLKVAESALSIDGRIWYVDSNNQTQFFTPNIAYKSEGNLYLNHNNQLNYPIDVVVSPPNSLLRGTEVTTDSVQTNSLIE